MNLKQQLQQDIQDAMRAQDKQRVNVLRVLFAALERAQEAMGKQAFDSFDSSELMIQLDRNQILSQQGIQNVIRAEVQRCQEAADTFRAGGENTRAKIEENEITILEQYLTKT